MRADTPLIEPPDSRRIARIQALIEVLLLSGLVSGALAGLPFALLAEGGSSRLSAGKVVSSLFLDTAITLALLALLMRWNGESWRSLGLERSRWAQNAMLGLALVPLLLLMSILVSECIRLLLPRYHTTQNPLIELVKTPAHLMLFIASSWIAGGFKEELQRAFILMRFGEHLGGYKWGLVIWSVVFGVQHYFQGPQGMITAAAFGFAFGLLYLIRGNLIGPIAAHGAYDTTALLLYWFSRG